MTAQDDDLGSFGQFTYSMGGDGRDFFDINPQTGEIITIAEPNQFDREYPPDNANAIIVSGEVSKNFELLSSNKWI